MRKEFEKEAGDLDYALKEYLRIRMDMEKISLLEKLSGFGAYLFKVMLVVYFSILIVSVLLCALAVWFGQTFENYFAGVLIAGAGLLVLAILLILLGKKLAVASMVSDFSRILLSEEQK